MVPYEKPFKLSNYKDCLSRLLHLQKNFDIKEIQCKNCKALRKSPLGHLSHLYTCGVSVDEQNQLKIKCVVCGEKFFPFLATHHKKSCLILKEV